jgi:hypothetical protein
MSSDIAHVVRCRDGTVVSGSDVAYFGDDCAIYLRPLTGAARFSVPCGDPPSQPVDTSEDAADSMKVVAGSMRAKALIWIMSRGSAGSTVDEAEAALDMRHQTISARFYELEYARCLTRGEDTRITRSGRKARVYRVTPLGEIRAQMAMAGQRR